MLDSITILLFKMTDMLMDYQPWYQGEPNDSHGREDVVNLLYKSGTWGLNDGYGGDSLRYVCEVEKWVIMLVIQSIDYYYYLLFYWLDTFFLTAFAIY